MTQAGESRMTTSVGTTSAKTDKAKDVPDYLKAIGMDPRQFWPKKYRFTREVAPGQLQPLTVSQRNFYEKNGFIVLEQCVSSTLAHAIRQQYNEGKSRGDQQPARAIDQKLLEKFLSYPKLLSYVSAFCDERVLLMSGSVVDKLGWTPRAELSNSYEAKHGQNYDIDHNRHRSKQDQQQTNTDKVYNDLWARQSNAAMVGPPDMLMAQSAPQTTSDNNTKFNGAPSPAIGFITTGHQGLYRDHIYLPFRPIDKVVCSVIALEPLEQVLLVVPGTHRVGQCNISYVPNDVRQIYEATPSDMRKFIETAQKSVKYVNLKPGQVLFYHPGLVHGFSEDLVNSHKSHLATIGYYAAGDCEFIDYKLSSEFNMDHKSIPTGLEHFGDANPSDYTSWIGRPKLIKDQSNL